MTTSKILRPEPLTQSVNESHPLPQYKGMNDVDWRGGRCSGTVYCAVEDRNEMLSEVRSFRTIRLALPYLIVGPNPDTSI